jgi:hypothetical protein
MDHINLEQASEKQRKQSTEWRDNKQNGGKMCQLIIW